MQSDIMSKIIPKAPAKIPLRSERTSIICSPPVKLFFEHIISCIPGPVHFGPDHIVHATGI
jgi:hypothetical protein